MNERERYIATLLYGTPDRVPFDPGGPRESTLKTWRTQGLPARVSWREQLDREIGLAPRPRIKRGPGLDADFRLIPQFEEKVIERRQGSTVVQDWKGNICEIEDRFDVTYLREAKDFCTRRWIKCPVENRQDWEEMKRRYDPAGAGRFPDDFPDRCRRLKDREFVLGVGVSGPFWQLREWMGFEALCMAFVEQPEWVKEMVGFWSDFVSAMLERMLDRIAPDIVTISEDMAYKEKAMISPAMTREFLLPVWRRWGGLLRDAGCAIYDIDSDGYIGELIPIWIEAGFRSNSPVEVAAGNDLPAYSGKFGKQMAYHGGVDKRAMAKGGRVIEAELERLAPVVRSGGYIPGCDHGVPSDVSWPCMVHYSRLLAQLTGWI